MKLTMENHYRKEDMLKEEGQYSVKYFKNRNFPNQFLSSAYMREFSQEEKVKIFDNAYSCINKFHQFVYDVLKK